jgi:hypothetical protein
MGAICQSTGLTRFSSHFGGTVDKYPLYYYGQQNIHKQRSDSKKEKCVIGRLEITSFYLIHIMKILSSHPWEA